MNKIDWKNVAQVLGHGLATFAQTLAALGLFLASALVLSVYRLVMWPSLYLDLPRQKMYSVGLAWGVVLTATTQYFALNPLMQRWRDEKVEVTEAEPSPVATVIGESNGVCSAKCVEKIRASRARIVGIEPNEVRYVRERYNDEYVNSATWRERAKNCVKHWDAFEEAEKRTLYPAELLAGKAFVEALGCQFIRATNGDGGIGPMQITRVPPEYLDMAAQNFGIPRSALRYKEDSEVGYRHNVVLGAITLSEYEILLESRGPGILAYNTGPGHPRTGKAGARGYMRVAGLDGSKGHTISDFRGAIPDMTPSKARPRIYVDRILAGAVMVDRARRDLPLVPLGPGDLTLEDIPGNDPRRDGEQFSVTIADAGNG